MAKNKAGLHKEVSAIFDGVPLPKKDGAEPSPHTPATGRTGYVPPRSAIAATQQEMPKQMEIPQPLPKPAPEQVMEPEPVKDSKHQIVEQVTGPSWLSELIESAKAKLFNSEPGGIDKRQKAMVLLVPVLAVVMIFMLMNAFKTTAQAGGTVEGTQESTAYVGVPVEQANWIIPELYPDNLRDPMRKGKASVSGDPESDSPESIVINGILFSEDNSSAVIQGRIVHDGDKIGNVTIVKINKDSVEFEMDGKSWTQKVRP